MSISSSANSARLHFTATSGQTAFSVSFEFFDDADLDVYVNGTQKTITTDYTVSGGDGSTGTVTFNSGLVLNDAVTITRRIDIERVTDFSAGQAINRAALNTQLDTLTAIASDNKDRSERALRAPDDENAPTMTLPSLTSRKGTVLGFNATTGAVEAGPQIADVSTLSAISADIATLADIEDGTDATDAIQNVNAIRTDVTTVAGINTTHLANVSSVATEVANASTNAATATTKAAEAATSASNAATSETNAATSATNAATSATAAAASQTAAAASAASAASSYDSFDDRYLGVKSSDPTLDNDGNALVAGALYFSSTSNTMQVYDGASWIAATSAGNVSFLLYEYTATSGQTTFSGADDNAATLSYTVNNIQVVMNGVTLDPSDYTATSGTSVVLASGAATSDTVNIYAFKSFTTADMVPASTGGTFAGNVAVTGDLTVDTNTLYVDSTNNRVGIEKSSPAFALDVAGECRFETDGGSSNVLYRFSNSGTTSGDNSTVRIDIAGTTASSFIHFGDADDNNRGQIEYNHNNDSLVIDVAASEAIRILSSGGITFNGDTAVANALDDYEEGTFTPTSTTDSGTAATFGTSGGTYTKIGNVVYFNIDITNIDTTGTTSSSQFRIDGLPFTVDVDTTRGVVVWDNITFQSTRTSCAATISTSEYIVLTSMGTNIGDTSVDYGDLSSGVTDVFISGFYYTDQ